MSRAEVFKKIQQYLDKAEQATSLDRAALYVQMASILSNTLGRG